MFKLINDAGLALKVESRGYRPTIAVPGFDVKLLKPQNIVEMVNLGQRDIGFTGADLIEELGVKNVTKILDTVMDKVKIVAAAPEDILDAKGEIISSITSSRKLVVVSEYKSIPWPLYFLFIKLAGAALSSHLIKFDSYRHCATMDG